MERRTNQFGAESSDRDNKKVPTLTVTCPDNANFFGVSDLTNFPETYKRLQSIPLDKVQSVRPRSLPKPVKVTGIDVVQENENAHFTLPNLHAAVFTINGETITIPAPAE